MRKFDSNVDFHTISLNQIESYNLNEDEQKLIQGTIKNRELLVQALEELNKPEPDEKLFGRLLNEHHFVLRDVLKVSTPKIELMLKHALDAGAYGAKIKTATKKTLAYALLNRRKKATH